MNSEADMTQDMRGRASERFLTKLRDPKYREAFVEASLGHRISLMIRALRRQRGWSQADLAERMGVHPNVVSRFENPDYCRQTVKTLLRIAAAFELPLEVSMPGWEKWRKLSPRERSFRRKSFSDEYPSPLREHGTRFWDYPHFKKGQRVRLSEEGAEAHIRPKSKHNQRGTVVKVDHFNSPTVLWDEYKTPSSYHPRFIAPVRKSP
jgi:transcriptional regulator with XRE-family HTH domain